MSRNHWSLISLVALAAPGLPLGSSASLNLGDSNSSSSSSSSSSEHVVQLEVQWFAPFFSGGGYCSEAISFAGAIETMSGMSVSIVQHGDSNSPEFVSGLPEATQSTLAALARRRPKKQRKSSILNGGSGGGGGGGFVAVCHSEPGAWHPSRWAATRCPPAGAGFAVGRTMFETDRLPSGWDERLNRMDQVWVRNARVICLRLDTTTAMAARADSARRGPGFDGQVPTEWARGVFEAGGVAPHKLRVLGEPVDVHYFDPARHEPLPLAGVGPGTTVLLSIFKWEERKVMMLVHTLAGGDGCGSASCPSC